MLLMHLGLMVLIDFADLSFMMVILHLFTFDPAWVPRRAPATTDEVFYDGTFATRCMTSSRACAIASSAAARTRAR
jgi:hypothetical protein